MVPLLEWLPRNGGSDQSVSARRLIVANSRVCVGGWAEKTTGCRYVFTKEGEEKAERAWGAWYVHALLQSREPGTGFWGTAPARKEILVTNSGILARMPSMPCSMHVSGRWYCLLGACLRACFCSLVRCGGTHALSTAGVAHHPRAIYRTCAGHGWACLSDHWQRRGLSLVGHAASVSMSPSVAPPPPVPSSSLIVLFDWLKTPPPEVMSCLY